MPCRLRAQLGAYWKRVPREYCGATIMFRGLFSVAAAQTQSSEGEREDMGAEGRGTQSN